MIDKKGVDEVIDILNPEAFYSESHNLIFTAMVKLFEETKPIDLLTVSSQLKKENKLNQVGGDYNNFIERTGYEPRFETFAESVIPFNLLIKRLDAFLKTKFLPNLFLK